MRKLRSTSLQAAFLSEMKRSVWCFFAACAAAAALAVLSLGLGGDFVFDDLPNIVENSRLHVLQLSLDSLKTAVFSYEPGHGSRPLAMLSFALDHWRAGGLAPATFKATNLAIHGITALGMAFMLRRLLRQSSWDPVRADCLALAVTFFWAVHPLQVSSVLYVVQRMQTLATMFLVLGLWAYLEARRAQIEGAPSLRYWMAVALSFCLGFLCKEDAVLMPLFALGLELSVLRFRSAQPGQRQVLKWLYGVGGALGIAVFAFVIVPASWHIEPYPGRNFSSAERLLTQCRVLMMYIGQMLLPRPENLPFYYDGLIPSRGLLAPVSTLFSLLGLIGLLIWAWLWRTRRPVFAFGIWLFFAGHFVTSNVLNLELAFEHRNQIPLLGILLAVTDVACLLHDRFKLTRGVGALVGVALALTLCTLSGIRASVWGWPLQFAQMGPQWAPDSPRAWQLLCKSYYDRSGGDIEHPFFSLAVQSCQRATELPDALVPLVDLLTLKAMQGVDASSDWRRLQHRLGAGVISPEGRDTIWLLIGNANKGVPLDGDQLAHSVMAYGVHTWLSPRELANLADFLLYQSRFKDSAYPLYLRAIRSATKDDPLIESVLRDLTEHGMKEWADRLRTERARQ